MKEDSDGDIKKMEDVRRNQLKSATTERINLIENV